MRNASDPVPTECPIPHLRLLIQQGSYVAQPTNSSESAFAFPRIPAPMLDWLMGLLVAFVISRQRCMVVLLGINPQSKSWTFVVPQQKCCEDHTDWNIGAGDASKWPMGFLLAGSVQSCAVTDGHRAMDAVPKFDGVHAIMGPGSSGPQCCLFCRHEGQLRPLNETDIVDLRMEDLLTIAAARMQLI